jgi:hypothetical protein
MSEKAAPEPEPPLPEEQKVVVPENPPPEEEEYDEDDDESTEGEYDSVLEEVFVITVLHVYLRGIDAAWLGHRAAPDVGTDVFTTWGYARVTSVVPEPPTALGVIIVNIHAITRDNPVYNWGTKQPHAPLPKKPRTSQH